MNGSLGAIALFVGAGSLALLLLLLLLALKQIKMSRGLERKLDEIERRIDDAKLELTNAAYLTSSVFKCPVPLGGPSIDSHHARTLVFLLQVLRPKRVLELGSGSSTVLISHYAAQFGLDIDSHVAVDHDERFLKLTEDLCKRNGVGKEVTFIHCPLVPVTGSSLPWYQIESGVTSRGPFDLVIVDGPPAYLPGTEQSRAPALPKLVQHLASNGVLIFDDTNRAGEAGVLEQWKREFPELIFDRRTEGKGHTVISRRPLF
jgi:predicted O-methyltransferase YrrM